MPGPGVVVPAGGREADGTAPDAQQAVLDLQDVLGLSDEMLPLYLEDLSATMFSMARRRAAPAPTAAELAHSELPEVERFLDRGHPGFVASSGRVGLGAAEAEAWAPEAAEPTALTWLAARRSLSTVSLGVELDDEEHVRRHLTAGERERFRAVLRDAGEDPDEYTVIPVHPWQWEHRILPGMLPDVLRRDLVLLGEGDHLWRAQQSLRTFLDVTDPRRDYAKTAMGVHSMGFLRGLSPAYMRAMPAISDWLHAITREDEFLRERGIRVLREHASVGYTGTRTTAAGCARTTPSSWPRCGASPRFPCWPRTSTPRASPGCCTRTVLGARWPGRGSSVREPRPRTGSGRCWTCTSCRWPTCCCPRTRR